MSASNPTTTAATPAAAPATSTAAVGAPTPIAPPPAFMVTNPVYASADRQQIQCMVSFNGAAPVPFMAMPNDPVAHGSQIYANCVAGLYGPVGPYVAPTPSPQAQYAAAIALGLAVTSASTPALNATYAIDVNSQSDIAAEAQFISTYAEFTNGQQTFSWLDATNTPHTFPSTALFMAFAKAAAVYVSACKQVLATLIGGGTATWPSNAAAIG